MPVYAWRPCRTRQLSNSSASPGART
jgi:hypothetical protein